MGSQRHCQRLVKDIDVLMLMSKTLTYDFILKHYIDTRSLAERRYVQSLIMIFKCMNNQGPTYINDFLNLKVQ